MSPLTRYGFAALIALFGVYQLNGDNTLAAVIAFVVAAAIALFRPRG